MDKMNRMISAGHQAIPSILYILSITVRRIAG